MSATTSNTSLVSQGSASHRSEKLWAKAVLRHSAQGWFVVAALGQWMFVAYVVLNYLGLALDGSPEALRRFGIHASDLLGNAAMALHVTLAALIIGGGPLQLIPQLRAFAPRFHHWNGRTYITAAVLTATGGLYLIWTRDIPGGLMMKLGVSLDAVLIFVFSALALRYAIARNFAQHRRWALRLFMVVSAVWFFRIGLMAWLAIHQAPVGFDMETFTGPFIYFLNFAQYLVPLLILECYFRAGDSGRATAQFAVAFIIIVATGLTVLGTFAAAAGMWLPEITADTSFWRA